VRYLIKSIDFFSYPETRGTRLFLFVDWVTVSSYPNSQKLN